MSQRRKLSLHFHPHCWERNVKYFSSNLAPLLGRAAVGSDEGEGWLTDLLFLQRDICLSGKRERKETKTTKTWWAERTHQWFPPGIKQIVDGSRLCRSFFHFSLSFIKLKLSGQLSVCYQAVWGWQRAGEEVCVYPLIKLIGLSLEQTLCPSDDDMNLSFCFTLSVTALLLCISSLILSQAWHRTRSKLVFVQRLRLNTKKKKTDIHLTSRWIMLEG